MLVVLTMQRIYLDYNASTPIDPAVAAAMRPFLEGRLWQSLERALGSAAGESGAGDARARLRRLPRPRNGRNRVHQRRQRGQQSRAQGSVLRARRPGDAYYVLADRTSGDHSNRAASSNVWAPP